MNELTTIETLTTEILFYKQQTAFGIVEIGKRLVQAKEILPHGEWGNWLREQVDLSVRTAQNFMRAATEIPNTQALAYLPPTKVFYLLELPPEEREQFATQPQSLPSGEIKTVDKMTTRELQAAIKARKAAEEKVQEAQERLRESEEAIDTLIAENQKLNTLLTKTEAAEPKEIEVIPPKIQDQLNQTENLIQEVDRLQSELKSSRLQAEAFRELADPAKKQADIDSKVSIFTAGINAFLRDMAHLGYMGAEVFRTSARAQTEYNSALTSLERWCSDMRAQITKAVDQDQIIEAEVIQ